MGDSPAPRPGRDALRGGTRPAASGTGSLP
jgi:hypothetical protein